MFAIYRLVMDERINPLAALPAVQRFQLMASLSMMWTAIFCAGAGAWVWYGELVVLHVGVLLGAMATAFVFRSASRQQARRSTHRDHPAKDGTARYDDVWGA
jgi:hypothetical protein